MPNPALKIIVENKIPFVKGLLDPYATVLYLDPDQITAKAVKDAAALVIRTRTRCNADLLDGSKVRLIATATIGTDHIDPEYCTRKGITVVNAPGCNAPAVAQYVFSSILHTANRPLSSMTIGVVGLGHVGSIVARWAEGLDMRVLPCDPPRQHREGGDQWVSFDTILREADIITLHTPLTDFGTYATRHLLNADTISRLGRAPIIINTARGAVVDTKALLQGAKAGKTGPLIIDCWENEPDINTELLKMASVATPHIAGYSHEGKVRASQVVMDAVTTFFSLPRVTVDQPIPPMAPMTVSRNGILRSFDPRPLTEALKANPDDFERLRTRTGNLYEWKLLLSL